MSHYVYALRTIPHDLPEFPEYTSKAAAKKQAAAVARDGGIAEVWLYLRTGSKLVCIDRVHTNFPPAQTKGV